MKRLIATFAVLLFAPIAIGAEEAAPPQAQAQAQAQTLQVEKIAVGTAIESRELSGAAAEFDASMTRLYCWTKVTASNPPSKIKHLWYADGKKEAEVALDINYPAARTWSSKNVWPGPWKVEVTDEAGAILSSVEFAVKAAVSAPAPQ